MKFFFYSVENSNTQGDTHHGQSWNLIFPTANISKRGLNCEDAFLRLQLEIRNNKRTPMMFGWLSSCNSLISRKAVRLIPSAASIFVPIFIWKIDG